MKHWRETKAVAQRILIELWRCRRSLLFWVVFPIFLLLINSLIFTERGNLSFAEAVEYAAPPTVVGAALFFSCLGGSVATVVAEREQKTLKRLFLSPLQGTSYFMGVFLAQSCIGLGQTFLIYGIALGVGSQFKGSILLGIGIVLLSIMSYVGIGFLLGTQLAKRTEDVNTLVATFGIPLLMLGGAFVPISLFPDSLLLIAAFNPIYHMTEALLRVWQGGETLKEIWEHVQFLGLFSLLMVGCGWLSYQRMLKVERQL